MSRPSPLRWRPVPQPFATIEGIDRALHRIENRHAPQPDEAQLLLAALCEQLHERLEQDGTPPRTVINLTAGQWLEVTKR